MTQARSCFASRLARHDLMPFIAKRPPVLIGMEACGGAHDWARRFREHHHEVKRMAPQFVKPSMGFVSRLGRLVELQSTAYGLHTGMSISRICSHLWPRASRDAVNRNSPSSASRAIARAFCPTVITPCANANLSEADGDVGTCWSHDCATQLNRQWRVTASSWRTRAASKPVTC
jgi:hypothetical protein